MKSSFFVFLFLLQVNSGALAAGTWISAKFEHNNYSYPYSIYLPEGYTPERKWPVILFLHGKAESGDDGVKQTKVGLGAAIDRHPERYPTIAIFPQATWRKRWNKDAREAAIAITDKVIAEYNGDRARVYLTGISLGGFATWKIAALYPHRFAAIIPVAATLRPFKLAARLKHTPIWAFHGSYDILVPAIFAQWSIDSVLKAGGKEARLTTVPAMHNAWDKAYETEELSTWLFGHKLLPPIFEPAAQSGVAKSP